MAASEPLIHTMSITKAAIGLMYHIHEKEFPRTNAIKNNERIMFTVGQALNMMTGYGDNKWDFDNYREQVEKSDANLDAYSKKQLSVATKIMKWKYNNLVYQLLASNMKDVADKFGEFMEDPADRDLKSEIDYKGVTVWFKHGKKWKWEHTSKGEPLGPHGLWMTESISALMGEKALEHINMARQVEHINMARQERIRIQQGWSNHFTPTKITRYWNGWWLSDHCAYAIGHVCQIIAITPTGVKTQLYEEGWDNTLDREENHNDPRWFFIDKIEEA